ncbi:restriction endonuclease subunit S [Aeromonas veronii]|uniref:restriction endonuclease subunit S n=1 Tax=Aeromonas veronii TaxID=654 RepID=UPI002A6AD575|nr:restriction endonuclease subunit S [Aeromonas veronii]
MVPKGWIISSLGDLGRWSGGGTPSKAITEYWENGTIPWVSPKDMGRERISITEDYITPSAVEKSSTKLYPAGSVLVVTRSGILRKKVPVALALVPVAVNQDIKVLPSSKTISTEYVANFMWCYNESILARCAKDGTTVESIDTTSLLGFPIKLPPLTEQKKIAKILSTWDKAITTTEQLLANSQQQKKALMQQLLTGKKRLLDIKTGVIFERDFKTLSLRDVCSMQAGKFINASDILNGHQDGTYPCFGGNGLRGYTKTFTHDGEFSLIGRQGALCGNITFATGCFHATEHAVVVTPRSNINTKWLYYALVDLNLNQYATGVAQPGLSVKNIEQVSIKVPESINEQQKIAAVLSAADQEITTLKQKLDALKQEKKALMQQLLTGKRRVQQLKDVES